MEFELNKKYEIIPTKEINNIEKGCLRDQSGENNNISKITEKDVLFIRGLVKEGYTTYKIHKEFYPYLHQQTIYAIVKKQLWKHI